MRADPPLPTHTPIGKPIRTLTEAHFSGQIFRQHALQQQNLPFVPQTISNFNQGMTPTVFTSLDNEASLAVLDPELWTECRSNSYWTCCLSTRSTWPERQLSSHVAPPMPPNSLLRV